MRPLARNGLLVAVLFWVSVALLLKTGRANLFNGWFLTVVLAMSIVLIVRMIQRRDITPRGQAASMPSWLRRWIED